MNDLERDTVENRANADMWMTLHKMAPPLEDNYPHHRLLKRVFMRTVRVTATSDSSACSLKNKKGKKHKSAGVFNLEDGNGRVHFTLLVSKDITFPLIDQFIEHPAIALPLDSFEYKFEGVKMSCLVYEPFLTLRSYMERKESSYVIDAMELHPRFIDVLKGYVNAMLCLSDHNYEVPKVSKNFMTVHASGRSAFLYPSPRTRQGGFVNVNALRHEAFKDMKVVVSQLCKVREVSFPDKPVGKGLSIFLDCMGKTTSREKSYRLLDAPVLMSFKDRLKSCIGDCQFAAWTHFGYKYYLDGRNVPGWKARVVGEKMYLELNEVLKTMVNDANNAQPNSNNNHLLHDTTFAFLHFIRNCVQHLNQNKSKLLDIPNSSSLLMVDHRLFIDFIYSVHPWFIEYVFL